MGNGAARSVLQTQSTVTCRRVWILVLLEATSNLRLGQHRTGIQWLLMNPHAISDRHTEADGLGSSSKAVV